ncbi:MAG: FecR domain-containing protein [Phormidesmis sp.]
MFKAYRSLLLAIVLGFLVAVGAAHAQQTLMITGSRWLAVSELSGPVELVTNGGARRRARSGDRLTNVGDTLMTGRNAAARLDVDQGTGYISMAANSQVRIQTLSITANGGRITELFVPEGRVRLQIRPLTNPDTRLEIHTPAGVSGVRGTVFGVSVQPNGQTGIATLEGSVTASAQGETVLVAENLQSTIRVGEPPTPPVPLRDDPTLSIEVLSPIARSRRVRIVGSTDPVNLFELGGEVQVVGIQGQFDLTVPLPDDRRIEARVTTPLGTEQTYVLVVP